MSTFSDHFSRTAASYASYRPNYPDALFTWLADQSAAHERAWDCGTGSGQAAVALASHFDDVIATDPSLAQLAHARSHPRVHYAATTAEDGALRASSVGLTTVAQALHWFHRPSFYREVRRVLRPRGVIAVWNYKLLRINPTLDERILAFYTGTVGPYWPAERALVNAGYSTLEFPFAEIDAPPFAMHAHWSLAQLAGYVGTWSATNRYKQAVGVDPVPEFILSLREAWGPEGGTHRVEWPLEIRAGVVD